LDPVACPQPTYLIHDPLHVLQCPLGVGGEHLSSGFKVGRGTPVQEFCAIVAVRCALARALRGGFARRYLAASSWAVNAVKPGGALNATRPFAKVNRVASPGAQPGVSQRLPAGTAPSW
jgi:hypothetical protein